MREELLEQLEEWHEEDEFLEIVNAVQDIPADSRDYVLINHLGRALNNLERYEEAVEQFLTVEEEGKDDPLWHYRIGLAYYYLEQYEDARTAFETADRLEPGDEDTQEFLGWIQSKTAEKPAEEEVPSAPESPVEHLHLSITDTESTDFWDDSNEALEKWVLPSPTEEQIESVEERLVFKLPRAYVDMMKVHNGGVPHYRYIPVSEAGAAEKKLIEISGMLGIGQEKKHSLCGEEGSRFIIEQGGYPEIGVVLCKCPSDSEIIMLDYRASDNAGEPEVVHVDKEDNYKITWLAPDFDTFVRSLVAEDNHRPNIDGPI
ncbi:SMI1/KNR4 family protein [Paenibacillus xylanilyticus]|uniref:SMI1/KNR4 family protein n=1 Tax=Paenibacillus xylanilyticus TaxID=248903 RepID=A0A7Y6BYL8_9BACL|nr:SMI1/KNR4 family protein [Paenibacillus xylanilyticus]NUU77357.1 SMI1/KNR4 family protein [Paenibacillus xylanilyticus]